MAERVFLGWAVPTDIDRIREFIKIKRKYASFFEWFKREKGIKEVGVVASLIESLSGPGPSPFQNLRASAKDPPDCLAKTVGGTLVGFEVTELVDQEAIQLNERGKEVYRDWTNAEVIKKLQEIIEEKDSKDYFGGPYEKLILVIPTDEPVLTHNQLKPILDTHEFNQTEKIHEAYLLFSYDPKTQGYPYIRLRLAANKTFK